MKQNRYALWATDEITKEFVATLEQEKQDNIQYLFSLEKSGDDLTKEYHRLRGSIMILDDIIETIQTKGKFGQGEEDGVETD